MTPFELELNYDSDTLSGTLKLEEEQISEVIDKMNDFLKSIFEGFTDPSKPKPENNLNSILKLLCSFSQEQVLGLLVNVLRQRVEDDITRALTARMFESLANPDPEQLHTAFLAKMSKGEA